MRFGAITPGTTPGVSSGRVIFPRPPPDPNLPPVHFYAEAVVNPGAEATVRSEALSNRTGRPIEIHEIRLSASTTTFTDVTATSMGNLGVIRVRLVAGGKSITNNFVPIWNLGRMENRFAQSYPFFSTSPNSYYVWRLSRPWHIPSNYSVEAQFFSPGMINVPVTARISLVGRYVAGQKTTTALPFATSYVSKLFDYSATDTDESSEKDLANFVGKTVHIDRIIGHAGVASSSAVTGNISSLSDADDQATNDIMTFRMVTSDNFPIVPEFTGIRQVFPYYPSSIDIAHDMDAGKFYRVSVRKTPGVVLAAPFTTYRAHVSISALGWREEGI